MKDHGHCPNCNVNLNGPLVWQTFFSQGHTKRGAVLTASTSGRRNAQA